MKIYLASDHAGFELKKELIEYLKSIGHEAIDMGPYDFNSKDDYPDFIAPLAKIVSERGEIGIVIGGSGQGEAIVANRFKGVRTAVYYGGPIYVVQLSREHNDANILSLGARFLSEAEAKEAVKVFIETHFSKEERHTRRIKKIDD